MGSRTASDKASDEDMSFLAGGEGGNDDGFLSASDKASLNNGGNDDFLTENQARSASNKGTSSVVVAFVCLSIALLVLAVRERMRHRHERASSRPSSQPPGRVSSRDNFFDRLPALGTGYQLQLQGIETGHESALPPHFPQEESESKLLGSGRDMRRRSRA